MPHVVSCPPHTLSIILLQLIIYFCLIYIYIYVISMLLFLLLQHIQLPSFFFIGLTSTFNRFIQTKACCEERY